MAETLDRRSAADRPGSRGETPSRLRMRFVDADTLGAEKTVEPLLEIRFEPRGGSQTQRLGPVLPLGTVDSPAGGPWVERWEVGAPVRRTRQSLYSLAESGPWFAGWAQTEGDDIEGEARELYCQLLTLAGERGWNLHRIWNVVPRINEGHQERSGLERYRLFCRGRAEAFDECWGPGFESRLCAFTAVGSETGPLVLHFLATESQGVPLENPRQMPAWSYPERYGPRSPSFARGLRLPEELGADLLLSGTASIVGHESLHEGDVVAQTQETIRNLRQLTGDGERLSALKVYLRDAADRELVEPLVAGVLADREDILWLRADLCRSELAIEIEGTCRG